MRALCRVWIEKNGKAFGEGPYRLMVNIEKTGSLSKAAKKMGISYKKAWTIINNCEKKLGFRLIEKKVGGRKGGGSFLTKEGKNFLTQYQEFREDIKRYVKIAFKKHFGNIECNQKANGKGSNNKGT